MEYTGNLPNRYFDIKLENGRITSLQAMQDERNTEFIEEGGSFGSVHVKAHTADGKEIVVHTDGREESKTEDGLDISAFFHPEGKRVLFNIELSNNGGQSMEIMDLAIPFPMNSRFAWGQNASDRVIRHSFISGNNSYLFFTRCDGKGPYLLFLPVGDAGFEFFDRFQGKAGDKESHDAPVPVYRAYIHSKRERAIAEAKGCKWRQSSTSLILKPLQKKQYRFAMLWADSYEDVREKLYQNGLMDTEVIPGMTVPADLYARICIRSKYSDIQIRAEYPEQTGIEETCRQGDTVFYDVSFGRLGENKLTLLYGGTKQSVLEFFVTEPIETLIQKRSRFIKKNQYRNTAKWYNGLFGEWSNDTSKLLGPDNYDRIKGWRIYEVTCDDPGLSKPAFLSCKNVVFPDRDEVEALEYYIDHFVWGGLQRTDEEEFSYGIYGIPDWHQNRNSKEDGPKGKLHIWRIYDYPHLILLYYNMYRIGRNFTSIRLNKPGEVYLERAYRTALAMFTIPNEMEDWSAYGTGLYNELVIGEIIKELEKAGEKEKSMRLRFHWEKKVRYFVNECTDVFGSEYPFDTTGFESTQALAGYALREADTDPERAEKAFAMDKAIRFMENQMNCNIACRGWLEPAYYLLGSDYRGCSAAYTLSYMSQMGGWAILDYALAFSDRPCPYLRLGYASILSSWALMNTGTSGTGYGYWFGGEQNDGAAGGGFEPSPYGETWLDQPHSRGSWYYSCEIDLGFCGALRAAATLLSFDDKFGLFCFGGKLDQDNSSLKIIPRDGIRQRFGIVGDSMRLWISLDSGHFSREIPIMADRDLRRIVLTLDTVGIKGDIHMTISVMDARYRVSDPKKGIMGTADKGTKIFSLAPDRNPMQIVLAKESN
jgi:hypothetical protein